MAKSKSEKSAREQLNDELRTRPGGPIGKTRKQARRKEELDAIEEGLELVEEEDEHLERIAEAFGYGRS